MEKAGGVGHCLALHRDQEVLDARAPRLDHRLHHGALRRVAVGVDHHAEVVRLEHRLEQNASWSSVVGVLSMKMWLSWVTVSVTGSRC